MQTGACGSEGRSCSHRAPHGGVKFSCSRGFQKNCNFQQKPMAWLWAGVRAAAVGRVFGVKNLDKKGSAAASSQWSARRARPGAGGRRAGQGAPLSGKRLEGGKGPRASTAIEQRTTRGQGTQPGRNSGSPGRSRGSCCRRCSAPAPDQGDRPGPRVAMHPACRAHPRSQLLAAGARRESARGGRDYPPAN